MTCRTISDLRVYASTRRRSQVVRQRSAKPRFVGSIPTGASDDHRDFRFRAAISIGVGNTLEAMITALLLRVGRTRLVFDDLGAVRTLVGVAAPAGAFASATIGVATLWIAGVISSSGVPSAFGLWWAGDYLGALVIAPVLVAFSDAARPRLDRAATVTLGVWVTGAVLATALVFGNFVPSTFLQPAQYAYLLFPFVIGAAL